MYWLLSIELYWNINMCSSLKYQSQQKSSVFDVCWNVLEASWTNSVGLAQTAPVGAAWSGSTLFASIITLVNHATK